MQKILPLIIGALMATLPIAALADGHATPHDHPIVVVDAPPPTSSINSGYILLGLVALLVVTQGEF